MCKIQISLRLPKVLLVGKNMLYVWDYPGDIRRQCTVSTYKVKSTTINYIIKIFYVFIYSDLHLTGGRPASPSAAASPARLLPSSQPSDSDRDGPVRPRPAAPAAALGPA